MNKKIKQKKAISTTEQGKQETKEQSLNVDKGLLNVEVTLPASFFEGQDLDTVIADAENEWHQSYKK